MFVNSFDISITTGSLVGRPQISSAAGVNVAAEVLLHYLLI